MFPELVKFNQADLPDSSLYIGAAGFEDRAYAFAEQFEKRQENQISGAIGIKYRPIDTQDSLEKKNDFNRFQKRITDLLESSSSFEKIEFDREQPQGFESALFSKLDSLEFDNIILDISAMSNILIMIILDFIADIDANITIYYAESDRYHPTKEKYFSEGVNESHSYLTSGILDVVSIPRFSSSAKSVQPIVAVTFPTFDSQKLNAVVDNLSPHKIITIEGVPAREENYWRLEAVKTLNKDIKDSIGSEERECGYFDYRRTFEILEEVYSNYSESYRLVISPTGSKIQTVGVSLFTRLHDDLQIVYPISSKYEDNYTEGWRDGYILPLGKINNLLEGYHSHSDREIKELRKKIEDINKSYP